MQRPQKSGFCEGVVDMDQYYTTGEFARMAHVTIRTIRYYDKKGLLKPSFINESGYRMYSDEDFLKLQKILSLKYLGFSLNEIGNMTIHDTSADILKSLKNADRTCAQEDGKSGADGKGAAEYDTDSGGDEPDRLDRHSEPDSSDRYGKDAGGAVQKRGKPEYPYFAARAVFPK